MRVKQIEKLADFMYSSLSSADVPFRLALTFGMGGCDISKADFIHLLKFLNKTNCTKEEFEKFLDEILEWDRDE